MHGFPNFKKAEQYLVAQKSLRWKVLVRGERPAVTLDQAAAHYIELEAARNKPSLDTEIYLLAPLLKHCGHIALDRVSNETLRPFVSARIAAGRKTQTINNALAVVRHICRLAARGWRYENGLTCLESAPQFTLATLEDQRHPMPMGYARKVVEGVPPALGEDGAF